MFLVEGFKGRKQSNAEYAKANDKKRSSRTSVLSMLLSDDLSVEMTRENINAVAFNETSMVQPKNYQRRIASRDI